MADAGEVYRRAGALFEELCEVEPDARAAALARERERDPETAELAARMLERDGAAGPLAFLSPAAERPGPADPDDPAGVLGTQIGPYRIEALLGCGGGGAVYRGRRAEPEAEVAVKFLTLSTARAVALERFRAEARLLARIDHPNVVRYRDSGVDRWGRPYLIMDLVDGEPLTHALPELAADVRRAVALVARVADAVHHLHQRRVLHRDLKPSNILVRRERHELVPIVLDLGVARTLLDPGADQDDEAALGATGTLGLGPVGTPLFMSPEQAAGDAEPDLRIDVHGLGAVLYALLTGNPPRDLHRVPSGDTLEFHRRLREGEARPPSQCVDAEAFGAQPAQRRARAIDRDLDAVVLTALARTPGERYGSAEALASDLRNWIDGRPVRARLVGPIGQLRRLMRRRPLESVLVGALLATVLLSAFAMARSLGNERAARQQSAHQLRVNEDTLAFFSEELFARARPENDGPRTPVVDVLRGALASFEDGAAGRSREVTVSVATNLLAVFRALDLPAEVDAVLAQGRPFAGELDGRHPLRLAFDQERAAALVGQERIDEARELLEDLWSRLESAPPTPSMSADSIEVRLARAAQLLGIVAEKHGELDVAERWLREGLARVEGKPGLGRERRRLLYEQAFVQMRRGAQDEAAATFRQLLDDFEAAEGDGGEGAMACASALASLHLGTGEFDLAVEYGERAFALADAVLEEDHENRLIILSTLGIALHEARSMDRAIEVGLEVVECCRRRYGADDPTYLAQCLNLVDRYLVAERGDEAAELARTMHAKHRRVLGDGHVETLRSQVFLARAEQALGRTAEAKEQAQRALTGLAEHEDVEHFTQQAQAVLDD
ncbi:MAG: serine/threonine-protein kinase [Planctomycetota bacterium]